MASVENRVNNSLLRISLDSRLAALPGLIGAVFFPALTVTAALKSEDFHPVSSGLSELAVGPDGWLQATAFIVLSISLAVFTGVLRRKLSGCDAGIGTSLMYLATVCMFMLSIVPTEADHTVWSINRFVHDGFSAGTAIAFPLGCFFLSRSFKADPGWHGLACFTMATVAVTLAANALSLLALTSLEVTGLQQMMILGAGLTWMGVVSAKLFSSGGKSR
jgi:hypothetical protein